MASDCGHTGTSMTWFAVGENHLALCSRCHAVVTQPWHDKLRETSAALAEAQRENEELRADLVWAVNHDAKRRLNPRRFIDEDNGSRLIWHEAPDWSARFAEIPKPGASEDICRAIREARRGE